MEGSPHIACPSPAQSKSIGGRPRLGGRLPAVRGRSAGNPSLRGMASLTARRTCPDCCRRRRRPRTSRARRTTPTAESCRRGRGCAEEAAAPTVPVPVLDPLGRDHRAVIRRNARHVAQTATGRNPARDPPHGHRVRSRGHDTQRGQTNRQRYRTRTHEADPHPVASLSKGSCGHLRLAPASGISAPSEAAPAPGSTSPHSNTAGTTLGAADLRRASQGQTHKGCRGPSDGD